MGAPASSGNDFAQQSCAFTILWALLLLFPLAAPNNFILNLGISWLISLALAGSLNLLMGYAGRVSLSHAAFYGLGAYASGVLSAKFGVSPWLGLCAAIVLMAWRRSSSVGRA